MPSSENNKPDKEEVDEKGVPLKNRIAEARRKLHKVEKEKEKLLQKRNEPRIAFREFLQKNNLTSEE